MNATRTVLNKKTGELEEHQTEQTELVLDEITGEFIPVDSQSIVVAASVLQVPDVSRKRKVVRRENWQENVRKRARLSGYSFVDNKGNIKPMKMMKDLCRLCRLNCAERVSHELRQIFFDKFHQLRSTRHKWEFILKYTRTNGTQRFNKGSRRQYSRKYFIGTGNHKSGSEEMLRVCQKTFLNTLSISDNLIRKAHEKILNNDGVLNDDLRGGHVRVVTELKAEQRKLVHQHINSFPKVDSHYSRESCNKQFLNGELSISKMYSLYFQSVSDPTLKVTERVYRDIFNSDFDLSFHTLKKDACDKCTQYQYALPNQKHELEARYLTHIKQKNLARSLKNQFKEEALKSNGETICAIFDYEKGIPLPRAEASSFYYKRKLTVNNFTVYETVSKQAYNFVYDESLTGCGPNEVCSCLYKFIESNVKLGVKKFLFVSDNCPGQNHNMFLYGFYAFCAAKFNINIEHLFLVRGHTQSEVDNVHSVIERALKKKTLFAPDQLYETIQTASKKNSHKIVKLTLEDILNFKVSLL